MKSKKGKKRLKIFLIVSLIGIIALELHLRYFWGFCDSVLMQKDSQYEYIAQPNQDRFRFRNHIKYNSFSMRSDEPDSSAFKIIGFGDSVINGSVMVDQDSVVTSLLTKVLSQHFNQFIQVLNVSAGSWGPDNCFAYIKKNGHFNARLFFLVMSSHDAYDNMDFRQVVDHDLGYESKQYKLAMWELWDRYITPRLFKPKPPNTTGVAKKSKDFNSGLADIHQYAKENNIPFFVYLHPDSVELNRRQYNEQGLEVISFCESNDIPYIPALDVLNQDDYRDIIHLKESGHRKMNNKIQPYIEAILRDTFHLKDRITSDT